MALIKWGPAYSVGIDEMDEQHRKLVDMINELHDAKIAGKGQEVIEKAITELVRYVASHFAAEEELMTRFRYPHHKEHVATHAKFAQEILAMQKRRESGQTVTIYEILQFARHWLTEHIQNVDANYGRYINAILNKAKANA